MNGLISWTVQQYVGNSKIKWLQYGSLSKTYPSSLTAFRKHSGFVGYATFLDLEDDQELLGFSLKVQLYLSKAIFLSNQEDYKQNSE